MDGEIPGLTEIGQAYDHRFAQGNLRESDSFYRWVLRVLKPVPGASLLDMSCGEGHLLRWAISEHQARAYGIDLSATALAIARHNAPTARLLECDGGRLPFSDNSFAFLTNLGSLEHYTNMMDGIQEIARVLRPDGIAAILLPNSYYLADIIWNVARTGYGPSHQQVVERFATAGEWKDLLEAGGVETLSVRPYNFCFPKSNNDLLWYRRRPRKLLNLMLRPLTPRNLSYCFLFLARKARQHELTQR